MTSPETPFPPINAFWAVFLSWLIAQGTKVVRGMLRTRRFNFRWLFDTGGMPSAHSASVASVATAMGLYYGFLSMPFLLALVFTVIIMFDATGVRRSAGRQAQVLNKMLDELYEKGQFAEERLKELLGHTPVEVFAGAFLGILITMVLCGAVP